MYIQKNFQWLIHYSEIGMRFSNLWMSLTYGINRKERVYKNKFRRNLVKFSQRMEVLFLN